MLCVLEPFKTNTADPISMASGLHRRSTYAYPVVTVVRRDVSEMITCSPSRRPSSISIVLTELAPSFTGRRTASLPSGVSTNMPMSGAPGQMPAARLQDVLQTFELRWFRRRSDRDALGGSGQPVKRRSRPCLHELPGRCAKPCPDQTVARIDEDGLSDTYAADLRFSNSQDGFQ